MIGKHVKGTSFRGLLNYLFGKEEARQIGGNMEGTNPRELAAEFGISRRLNPKVSRAVYHASLSLPHHESLDDDTWHEIAQKYLQEMGFEMNQYVVVRHTDRTHDHTHIAASRIQLNGSTVSDSWDHPRSEVVIRKLEKEYNLQSVQPSWEKDQHSPTTGERRQLARTGQESVRVKLQRSLDAATHDCPTMPELMEKAQKDGINICINYTYIGKVKGISYKLDGVAFSGTHLGKAYTFPGLQKYRDVSYIPKRDDKRIQKLMERNVENATSNQGEHDDKHIQKLTEQTTINATSSQSQKNQQQIQMERNVENNTLTVSSLLDDNDIQIEQSVDHATAKENIELLQKLIEQTIDNSTPTVRAKPDNKDIQKQIEPPFENATAAVTQTNYLPTPEPANWEQVRQNLHQQYNLPIPLLNELYQKGWLYPNQTGQPVFVERTLDNVPTLAKQLELTGDFTAIPLNYEATKNGSFWIATDTTVTRAVLLSDPIEVLSVIALESTVDKKQRQSTLYWSVGESEQIPLEFLQSLDTVVIAFKDHEKNEELISEIIAKLPQSKRVSPGQAGWNKLLTDKKQPVKKQQITQTLDWKL
jgi:hypothetical protein